MVQWLRLHTGGVGLIPGQGTKILHAVWEKTKKKPALIVLFPGNSLSTQLPMLGTGATQFLPHCQYAVS